MPKIIIVGAKRSAPRRLSRTEAHPAERAVRCGNTIIEARSGRSGNGPYPQYRPRASQGSFRRGAREPRAQSTLAANSQCLRNGLEFGTKSQLDDMKVTLMGMQLLRGHFLNRERVVGSVGDNGIAVTVILGGREQRVEIGENRVAEVNASRERVIGNRNVAKVGTEHERATAS